ncbi:MULTISPECIES: hypothetical protein [unclassified Yoonia]|uniref:hypothetical protein n=1 Tax=unclassified Yoonia TaxID=2629118 RepID=UPI002AFE62D5|nr:MULTISPECIES: hypothetical protein [unclassified Yoonia]
MRVKIAIAAIALASGCTDQIIDNRTVSRFATPSSAGTFSSPSGTNRNYIIAGQGFAYKAGVASNQDIVAVAGIIPGTTVTAIPTTGNTVYAGQYRLVSVGGFTLDNGLLRGTETPVSGSISLGVNFAERTISGTSGNLAVNGTFVGNTMSGDVTYSGISGDLRGVIGGDKAVGAFHGESPTQLFAGGFYVTPR